MKKIFAIFLTILFSTNSVFAYDNAEIYGNWAGKYIKYLSDNGYIYMVIPMENIAQMVL